MPCRLSWSRLFSRSLLLTGPLHRLSEVADKYLPLPPQDGISLKRGKMLRRKPNAPPRIDGETPHRSPNTACQPQLAGWIQEEEYTFADAVALATRPKADPLGNGHITARRGAADRIFNMKSDGDGIERLTALCRMPLN